MGEKLALGWNDFDKKICGCRARCGTWEAGNAVYIWSTAGQIGTFQLAGRGCGSWFLGGIGFAWNERMITALCLFGALAAGVLLTEIIAINAAPVGYQDETGFHFGQPLAASWELENPS